MASNKDLQLLTSREHERPNDYVTLLEQFPFRPTLFLGLGGTGSQAVAKIKELFLRLVTPQAKARLKADAPDMDQLYGFLAFDTNQAERPKTLDVNREWYHLGVGDLGEFYGGVGKGRDFEPWVVKGFQATNINAGASGFRNLGRLAMLFNINTVHQAIEVKYSQIIAAAAKPTTVNPAPVVYVFCSLSGGTGSGMFLDACFVLRNIFGLTADINGLVAILDGLPTMPSTKRETMQINTFGALKELNAFMSGTAEGYRTGDRILYPFNVSGRVAEPFSECYLISPYRADGAKNLPTQGHVTSFMARYAFMMSAFSFLPEGIGDTPDWAGVMVNHKDELAKTQGGARTWAIVPGLAQTHFPINDIANIIALEAAARYIRYQCSGTAREGEDDARNLMVALNLGYEALRNLIAIDPKGDRGLPLPAMKYDDIIHELLESKDRYNHPDDVLAYGKKMPAARTAEIEKLLSGNVNKLFGTETEPGIWQKIEEKTRGLLADAEFLGLGALDFVEDLKRLFERDRDFLVAEGRKRVDPAYGELERRWTSEIFPIIDDVVTETSVFDRIADNFKIGKAQALYIEFLNEADMVVLEKVRNELTRQLLSRLIEHLSDLASKLGRLIRNDLPKSIQALDQRSREIYTRLRQEAEGTDPSIENVCSVSVMTQEWVEKYTNQFGWSGDLVLGNLLKSGWHPLSLININPPQGVEVSAFLAQAVLDKIEPLTDSMRSWSPMEVLNQTSAMRGSNPAETIAEVFYNLKPQMRLTSMKTQLGVAPYGVVVTGGLERELINALKNSDALSGEDKLTSARNQETHRINFFSATIPVALAGCDLVRNQFEPAYNRWLEALAMKKGNEQETEMRLFHCFPRSYQWPSPSRAFTGVDPDKEIFGCALALSEMLPVSPYDKKRMASLRAMKEPGYSVFQIGKGAYWLWPFFEPSAPDAVESSRQAKSTPIKGKPAPLGSNVFEAFNEFARNKDYQIQARQWVNWFSENWFDMFKAWEVEELKKKAIESFNARKGRTSVPDQVALWDDLMTVVQHWQVGG